MTLQRIIHSHLFLQKTMKILVTGGAGFIGAHTIKKLIDRGDEVICVDDFSDGYDPALKEARIKTFLADYTFPVYRTDIRDLTALRTIFQEHKIDKICHLAARAGVRTSIAKPFLYEEVNVRGTMNMLEVAREFNIKNFVFASTSAVYGGNTKLPFSESDRVDTPLSPYAASKKSSELMAYYYHHLYKLPCIGLRFFTVYGPWGRPDMALFVFTDNIIKGQPIDVYNHGKMRRDFTYIDDIVSGVVSALDQQLDFEIINLGHNHPEDLMEFIGVLEKAIGRGPAQKNLMPLQPGDVPATSADIAKAQKLLGFAPKTAIQEGIPNFVNWYKDYYKIQ